MSYKEGEIVWYNGRLCEVKMMGGYENGREYDNRYFRDDLVLIKHLSSLITVPLSSLRKATKQDTDTYKYADIFIRNGRKIHEYRPGDIVTYEGNIQEVYAVKQGILTLELAPAHVQEVIPVCFCEDRLDVR